MKPVKNKHKKITFMCHNMEPAGVQNVVLTLLQHFSTQYKNIDLVLLEERGELLNQLPENVNVVGLTNKTPKKIIKIVMGVIHMHSYLLRNQPDLVFSSIAITNYIILVARLFARTKSKVLIREADFMLAAQNPRSVRAWFYKKIVKYLYSQADAFVSPSRDLMASIIPYISLPASKRHIIYNPTVTQKLYELRAHPASHPWCVDKSTHKLIVSVGTLKIKKKGLDILLSAFKTVHDSEPETRLLLVGDGPDYHLVKELISKLKLKKAVQLIGFKDNPFPYMKAADVFVLPSRWEGLPNTLIQAIACGTTPVATNCPSGPREILSDGEFGYLIPPNDSEKMAAAIIKSLDNPISEDKLAKQASAFSEHKILHQYNLLIENMLAEEIQN